MATKVDVPKKKKINLKEKIEDDTLNLSLCELDTIPIKEIAELTKIRKLNLSFNALTSLPEEISKLQHIREIDLSKNRLKTLPKSFGNLVNLKSLDLLGNQITGLPSTFSELKGLQWLDLKDNPLHPQLKQAAGDCLDEAQCRKCAVNVVKLMKQVASDEERLRQLELKKKREEEAKREAEERAEAELQRQQKKLEREQRRLQNEKRKLEEESKQHKQQQNEKSDEATKNGWSKANGTSSHSRKSNSTSCIYSFFSLLFRVLVILSFVFFSYVALRNYCQMPESTRLNNPVLSNQYLKSIFKFLQKDVCPRVNFDLLKHPHVNRFLRQIKLSN